MPENYDLEAAIAAVLSSNVGSELPANLDPELLPLFRNREELTAFKDSLEELKRGEFCEPDF